MSLGHGASIVRNNLKLQTDISNVKSYSGSGNWKSLIDGSGSISGGNSVYGTPTWADGMTAITISVVLSVEGTDTNYAYNPIKKFSNTTTATFALYHFQQFTDNLRTNLIGMYANAGGTWQAISSQYFATQGNTYIIDFQYDSNTGGQLWINGEKIGSRSGSRGVLGTDTAPITIDGGPTGRSGIHTVKYAAIYDAELTDNELKQNFEALRGRYGI
jgi:hypothetical protein